MSSNRILYNYMVGQLQVTQPVEKNYTRLFKKCIHKIIISNRLLIAFSYNTFYQRATTMNKVLYIDQ